MKNAGLIIMACIVLLIASGSDMAGHTLNEKAKFNLVQSEADQQEAEDTMILIFPADIFNSVVNIAHLVFHSDLISEFELPEINETNAHSVIETALNFTKHYRTLFQIFISPNAP